MKEIEKVLVIAKMERGASKKADAPILFFPAAQASFGKIACWSLVDGHCEADLRYFWACRRPRDSDEADIEMALRRYQVSYCDIEPRTELSRVFRDSEALRKIRWANYRLVA